MDRRQFLLTGAATILGARAMATARSASPVALVTADAESHVAVVNLATGRVVRRIDTPRLPRSIERVGSVAVVAHSDTGRVTLLQGARLTPRELEGRFGEPRYAAAHPDGRHAFITDSGLGDVVVVDVLRGRVVGRVGVGGPARHLALDPSGTRLWTALGTTARRVAILDVGDVRRPSVRRTIAPPFLAHDVVFAPGGGRVWVTSGDRGSMAIYDAATGMLIRRLPGDAAPQHLAFSERGRVAYVTSGDEGTLRVHDLEGRPLRTTRIPVGSFNVTRGAGYVVSPSLSQGTLCVLDRNGSLRRTVDVASAAHDVCVL